MQEDRTCSAEGCSRLPFQKGRCQGHYREWLEAQAGRPPCSEKGCPYPYYAKGHCKHHYDKARRPSTSPQVRSRPLCVDCGEPKRGKIGPRCRSCARRKLHQDGHFPKEAWNKTEGAHLTCEACGKTFRVEPYRAEIAKVCSRACGDELKRRVTGKEHPLYKPKVPMACEVCGTVCQVKPSLVERFRFCSRSCTGIWVTRNMPKVSSIEDMVAAYLDAAGVAYQQQVALDRYTPDFVVGRTVIEVDGSYWHSLPRVVTRDQQKDHTYRRLGYAVIRIGETAIRAGDFSALDPVLGSDEQLGQRALF